MAADRSTGTPVMDTVQRGTARLRCREAVQQLPGLPVPQNNLEKKPNSFRAEGIYQSLSGGGVVWWWERWSRLWKSGFSLGSATSILHSPGQVAPDPQTGHGPMGCRRVRVAPQPEQPVQCSPLKRLRAWVEGRSVRGNWTVLVMGETQGDGSFFPL